MLEMLLKAIEKEMEKETEEEKSKKECVVEEVSKIQGEFTEKMFDIAQKYDIDVVSIFEMAIFSFKMLVIKLESDRDDE